MPFTLLPQELLEEIVQYLGVKELLACSAVNLEWRERLNINKFWKKFCLTGIEDYLEKTPCQVEPYFSPPENYGERLEPLCEWRIRYMRNVHLLNNWRTQRVPTCPFRPRKDVLAADLRTDCDKEHWLFIRTIHTIEIWSIENQPEFFTVVTLSRDSPSVSVGIAGKSAVVTQWNIVTVYDLRNKGEWKTFFRFALEDDKLLPPIQQNSSAKNGISLIINQTYEYRYINFGSLLVGYKRVPWRKTKAAVHIWDTCSKEKLKTENVFEYLKKGNEIKFINVFKMDEGKGIVRTVFRSLEQEKKNLHTQINIYDFNKLACTKTVITFVGVAVWCGYASNIIVSFRSNPGGVFQFHSHSSGKFLWKKEIGEHTTSDQIQLVHTLLLYCTFNCMNVLDILSQEVIYCLQFGFYSFVKSITAIEPRFIVVWLLESGEGPGYPSYYQEIWDVRDFTSKRLQCSSDRGLEILTHSPSVVKQVLIYNSNLCVYSFW